MVCLSLSIYSFTLFLLIFSGVNGFPRWTRYLSIPFLSTSFLTSHQSKPSSLLLLSQLNHKASVRHTNNNKMSSGVGADDECVNVFNELKLRHTYKYIIYKISDDKSSISVEKTGAKDATYGSSLFFFYLSLSSLLFVCCFLLIFFFFCFNV